MRSISTLPAIILLLCFASVFADDLGNQQVERAKAAIDSGDYESARSLLEPFLQRPERIGADHQPLYPASTDDSAFTALSLLAQIYEQGWGVEKSAQVSQRIYSGLYLQSRNGVAYRGADPHPSELFFAWRACDLASGFGAVAGWCGLFERQHALNSEYAVAATDKLAQFLQTSDNDLRFIRSVQLRRFDEAQAALNAGANVNGVFPVSEWAPTGVSDKSWGSEHFTAASHATHGMRSDTIEFLVKNGADLNVNPDPDGRAFSLFEPLSGVTISFKDKRGKVTGKDFFIDHLVANGYQITPRDIFVAMGVNGEDIPDWLRPLASADVIAQVERRLAQKADYKNRRNKGTKNHEMVAEFNETLVGQFMADFFRSLEADTNYLASESWHKTRIEWPGAWGDETVIAFLDSVLAFRESNPTGMRSWPLMMRLQDGLKDSCVQLGGAVIYKFDRRKSAIDDNYGWCVDRNDQANIRFWYELSCFALVQHTNCIVRVKSVLEDTATDHGRERILKSARSNGMATGEEASKLIAKAEAQRLEEERAAAEAAAAEQQRREEEARARAVEQRRIAQQRERLAKELRTNVALGVETHCGMIIQIRESLVEVQTIAGNKWLRISQLYAPGTAPCRFFNNQYQEPF